MNILYFPFEFPPFFVGGLGTYAFEMTRRFARMGHSVTVFSKNPGDAITRDLYEGVEVHRPLVADVIDLLPLIVPEDVKRWPVASQNYFADVFMYNLLAATKTVNLLAKGDKRTFDIIVAHDWLSAIAGIVCKKALKKPLVFHLHSVEQGRVGNGSATIKNLEKLAGTIADGIITVSYAMRDQLVSLGYEEGKINVVLNGVDEEKYNPESKSFTYEKIMKFREKIGLGTDPMILFVGRLAWVKGADTLVRAMPIILKEIPNAKLVILGKGDQEELIKHLITHLGIQDSVKPFFKYVDEKERLLYYAACDMAVFPSKYEPFGIVCTEAMSMGKPVIVGAKGVSGFREQIVPTGSERCGAHIDPEDPHDIAKFAVEMLKSEVLRRELGGNARRRVLQNYTLDKVADETIEIYRKIAGVTES
ncbi:MAG: glycosyltransferase family 4 protein [Hadesarchaea archaeon]|nr:glycosyltransferase family 4 protein [Hadesarchaea archaeon]